MKAAVELESARALAREWPSARRWRMPCKMLAPRSSSPLRLSNRLPRPAVRAARRPSFAPSAASRFRVRQNSAPNAASLKRDQPATSQIATHARGGVLPMNGVEWVVEAFGCSPEALQDTQTLRSLFDEIIAEMKLRPVSETPGHQFPRTGGITGLCLLAESHLACHTFPEHGSLCLNLFCCVPRPEWNFERALQNRFASQSVTIRRLVRSYEMPREQAASD